MKQNITYQQLDELTKKQSDKFCGWILDHGYEDNSFCASVGEMIEFLEYAEIMPPAEPGPDIWGPNDAKWEVQLRDEGVFYSFELCDALFKAVKQVLEKE